jgi:hypothetical protein
MAAGYGGAVVGMILNETVLFRFGYPWMFYVATIGCAAVAGWLCTRYFEKIVIISTSLLGAYAIARGASFYLGHYYNEFTIAKLVQSGLYDSIDQLYWAYVGGFLVLTIAGYFFQSKRVKQNAARKKVRR